MDSRCDGKRMNVDGDRLSSLPDDLIHKILSFVGIKKVVETSVLSSRWRFIWTSMPYLNLFCEDFYSMLKFSKVVTSVLSGRNDQVEVHSLMLSLNGRVSRGFVKRILNYAFAHNVQHMSITCLIERRIEVPLFLFRSQSLKHLTLFGSIDRSVVSTWELPALTTLHLSYVSLYDKDEHDDNHDDDDDDENDDEDRYEERYEDGYEDDYYDHDDDDDENEEEKKDDNDNNIISMCPNLKNLTLDGCKIMRSIGFKIRHPQLSNLTLKNGGWRMDSVHAVVPQLKNLAIVNCDWVHLSAPDLTSFTYRSRCSLKFSIDSHVSSLEEADICIGKPQGIEAHAIIRLLQQFHSVKSLTLNLETIEVLSSLLEQFSSQYYPFANLRSLKIYPVNIRLEGQAQKKVAVSNFVRKYFLDCSPSASYTLVTREEIKASDTTLVQHLMAELRLQLERDIASVNLDDMEREEEPSDEILDDSRLDELLDEQIMQSYFEERKFGYIISKLQHIEGLLTKLPTSNRANLQLVFDSLCAEAKFVMKRIDRTETQWKLLSDCSDTLAKALVWWL